jgi:hypothetical protein
MGPWEYAARYFHGIRADGSVRWDIPMHPRGWKKAAQGIADFCDRRDAAWRRDYACRHATPPARWKR